MKGKCCFQLVVPNEVDDVLDAVDEGAMRHQACGLGLLEAQHHDDERGARHEHPAGVLRQAKHAEVARDGL